MLASRMIRADDGSASVELAIVMMLFIMFIFAAMELAVAFYQWNAAAKAVELGARLAAVSTPVGTLPSTGTFGNPPPTYDIVCTSSSTDGATGSCTGGVTYNATAMQ